MVDGCISKTEDASDKLLHSAITKKTCVPVLKKPEFSDHCFLSII